MRTSLVWFWNDFRLADNPALAAALRAGRPVIPVYVLDDRPSGGRPLGAASRWWLHHSLEALDSSLRSMGSRLILKRGATETVMAALARECGAEAIFWNHRYDQESRKRQEAVSSALRHGGLEAQGCSGNLLFEPDRIVTANGSFYKVFTAFWRAARASGSPSPPLSRPRRMPAPNRWPKSDRIARWGLLPTKPDWAGGLRSTWQPGEKAATAHLRKFLRTKLSHYKDGRDIPADNATSRLSPHLAFGEISPRSIWRALSVIEPSPALEKFRSELGWREFSYNLLFHHDGLAKRNFRSDFDAFPWRTAARQLAAWQAGCTGYPIVDAGMRELWATGWMQNRVRMVVASFLVKDLLIDWRAGERWFWDTLVDADLADNAANWQWVAGCGADAAPYFRVFNPVLQGEKFDVDGRYVRTWVPELARLPSSVIHRPWTASNAQLESASVTLGKTYPERLVEHHIARDRALSAFRSLKKT